MDFFFLFPTVILVLFAHEGRAATSQIRCYQCSSTKSYEDCEAIQKEKECQINVPGFDWTCGKLKSAVFLHNMTSMMYSRDCILLKECKEDAFCKSKRGSFEAKVGANATVRLSEFSCEMHCCNEDLCNAASSFLLSNGFSFRAFAAFAVLFLFFFH
ncbi:uncharacterized protein LOC116290692 [Actinia tenebrosa]|uniref:Uncharacterized protein LOC116290692 n=1 Tax=Actinia tenebrosa TaxID=6105 RepID=A0A6P8HM16_ACTTE|nr:uncharacterized protein LOC116290692 [Actinia tenebrosa]